MPNVLTDQMSLPFLLLSQYRRRAEEISKQIIIQKFCRNKVELYIFVISSRDLM